MNIQEYEEKYSVVKWLFDKAKNTTLPGMDGVAVFYVIQFFIEEIKKGSLVVQAKAVAFTFFLALFPYIVFMFTLIPYVPIDGIQEYVLKILSQMLPEDVYLLIDNNVMAVLQSKKGGLLSLGLILTLWISTNGMMGVMDSFDRAANIIKRRKAWHQRLVAFELTMIVFVLLVVSLVLIVTGNWLIKMILYNLDIHTTFNVIFFSTLEWIILILLFFTAISSIYYIAPNYKQKWSMTSLGSTVATILIISISLIFQKFVSTFGRHNEIYGPIGTVIIMQIFIYLNSFALLIGFELNVSIRNAKEKIEQLETEQSL